MLVKKYATFRLVWLSLTVLAAILCGIVLSCSPVQETLSRVGSTGYEVRRIQTALQKHGYYGGEIDGVYGSQTEAAVREFQRREGLTVDGICGSQTLRALGIGGSSSSYRRGSRGEEVSQIQSRLREWGYYSGSVDGIYGAETEAAVSRFQRKNGLSEDGICGVRTLSAMGLSSLSDSAHAVSANNGNVYLLARIISAEARGESYRGQVAVGAVVLNRVRSAQFPNTLAGVIYQKGAFTAVDDGQFDEPVADSAYRAAREALAGADPTGGCLYYYNPSTATSSWIFSLPVKMTIGKHRFSMGK